MLHLRERPMLASLLRGHPKARWQKRISAPRDTKDFLYSLANRPSTGKMFPRALLLLLGLSCAALCSAQQLQETTTKAVKITTTLSEVEILLTATVCSAGSVLLVLIPTIVYNRYFKKDLGDEVL